jgi:hypothetical protein
VKVYIVLIEDRSGNQIRRVETCDAQGAEAAINEAKAANPDAMITRTEREA